MNMTASAVKANIRYLAEHVGRLRRGNKWSDNVLVWLVLDLFWKIQEGIEGVQPRRNVGSLRHLS